MVNATEGMGRARGVLAFLEIVHLVYARSHDIEKKTSLTVPPLDFQNTK